MNYIVLFFNNFIDHAKVRIAKNYWVLLYLYYTYQGLQSSANGSTKVTHNKYTSTLLDSEITLH